jgi:hypothetical protein
MNVNKLEDKAERVVGDPRRTYALYLGKELMPALTTAAAKWEWRQTKIIDDRMKRWNMTLAILRQFIAEHGRVSRVDPWRMGGRPREAGCGG